MKTQGYTFLVLILTITLVASLDVDVNSDRTRSYAIDCIPDCHVYRLQGDNQTLLYTLPNPDGVTPLYDIEEMYRKVYIALWYPERIVLYEGKEMKWRVKWENPIERNDQSRLMLTTDKVYVTINGGLYTLGVLGGGILEKVPLPNASPISTFVVGDGDGLILTRRGDGEVVQLYARILQFWNNFSNLTHPEGIASSSFGKTMRLVGDTLLISDPSYQSNKGIVYVYILHKGNFKNIQNITLSRHDTQCVGFGSSIDGYRYRNQGVFEMILIGCASHQVNRPYFYLRAINWTLFDSFSYFQEEEKEVHHLQGKIQKDMIYIQYEEGGKGVIESVDLQAYPLPNLTLFHIFLPSFWYLILLLSMLLIYASFLFTGYHFTLQAYDAISFPITLLLGYLWNPSLSPLPTTLCFIVSKPLVDIAGASLSSYLSPLLHILLVGTYTIYYENEVHPILYILLSFFIGMITSPLIPIYAGLYLFFYDMIPSLPDLHCYHGFIEGSISISSDIIVLLGLWPIYLSSYLSYYQYEYLVFMSFCTVFAHFVYVLISMMTILPVYSLYGLLPFQLILCLGFTFLPR